MVGVKTGLGQILIIFLLFSRADAMECGSLLLPPLSSEEIREIVEDQIINYGHRLWDAVYEKTKIHEGTKEDLAHTVLLRAYEALNKGTAPAIHSPKKVWKWLKRLSRQRPTYPEPDPLFSEPRTFRGKAPLEVPPHKVRMYSETPEFTKIDSTPDPFAEKISRQNEEVLRIETMKRWAGILGGLDPFQKGILYFRYIRGMSMKQSYLAIGIHETYYRRKLRELKERIRESDPRVYDRLFTGRPHKEEKPDDYLEAKAQRAIEFSPAAFELLFGDWIQTPASIQRPEARKNYNETTQEGIEPPTPSSRLPGQRYSPHNSERPSH